MHLPPHVVQAKMSQAGLRRRDYSFWRTNRWRQRRLHQKASVWIQMRSTLSKCFRYTCHHTLWKERWRWRLRCCWDWGVSEWCAACTSSKKGGAKKGGKKGGKKKKKIVDPFKLKGKPNSKLSFGARWIPRKLRLKRHCSRIYTQRRYFRKCHQIWLHSSNRNSPKKEWNKKKDKERNRRKMRNRRKIRPVSGWSKQKRGYRHLENQSQVQRFRQGDHDVRRNNTTKSLVALLLTVICTHHPMKQQLCLRTSCSSAYVRALVFERLCSSAKRENFNHLTLYY